MRYFLEVAYMGTRYAGFQVQENANTVQAEVEKVIAVYLKHPVSLTGSSRTDAGVHAHQNYFHFDVANEIPQKALYNFNAMLPADIVVKSLIKVHDDQHCRFDALWREYKYVLYSQKDPFLQDRAWYYPYSVDEEQLHLAAELIKRTTNFESFAKRNSQVHTHKCSIMKSEWRREGECLVYNVQANRFLRGMVRGLVGTMLLVGRKKISLTQLQEIIAAHDCTRANFTTPAYGLHLLRVAYSFLP